MTGVVVILSITVFMTGLEVVQGHSELEIPPLLGETGATEKACQPKRSSRVKENRDGQERVAGVRNHDFISFSERLLLKLFGYLNLKGKRCGQSIKGPCVNRFADVLLAVLIHKHGAVAAGDKLGILRRNSCS